VPFLLFPNYKQGVDFRGRFELLVYGSGDTFVEIDHLIPQSKLSGSGKRAVNTIRSFAPLISPLNNEARATPCSTKLKIRKFFGSQHHPYHDWLLGVHAIKHGKGDLDDETNIKLNKPISDERMDYIVDELMDRL
jgi:hypothetical protein